MGAINASSWIFRAPFIREERDDPADENPRFLTRIHFRFITRNVDVRRRVAASAFWYRNAHLIRVECASLRRRLMIHGAKSDFEIRTRPEAIGFAVYREITIQSFRRVYNSEITNFN